MNPLTRIPDSVRFVLYLIYGIGSPVMAYLLAEGYVGENELVLWGSIGTFLGATAASNMGTAPKSEV